MGLELFLIMENRMILDAQGLVWKDAQCQHYSSASYCAVFFWGMVSGWQQDTPAMVFLVVLGYKWGGVLHTVAILHCGIGAG